MKNNNYVSRRARPRQHSRRLKSGKKIVVNKGVRRKPVKRKALTYGSKKNFRKMYTSPNVNTFETEDITIQQQRDNLATQAGVIAELRALELEAKAKGLMDVAKEYRKDREKEESKLSKENKMMLDGRRIQKEVITEGKVSKKNKDRSIRKYKTRYDSLTDLYGQMKDMEPAEALKFYKKNNIEGKLYNFRRNASDVNTSDAALTANEMANLFHNQLDSARVATGDLTSEEKKLVKVGERFKNMPESTEVKVRIKNPFGVGFIEGTEPEVERALKLKQFENDVLTMKGKKDAVWSPDQINRFAALAELKKDESAIRQKLESGAAKQGARDLKESLRSRGISDERLGILKQAEKANQAGDIAEVDRLMGEYERAYNPAGRGILPPRTPGGNFPRELKKSPETPHPSRIATDEVPGAPQPSVYWTVNDKGESVEIPVGMEKYFKNPKKKRSKR